MLVQLLVVLSASPCVDFDPLCFTWSLIGECDNTNAKFMELRCASSCGLCTASETLKGDDPRVVVLGSSFSFAAKDIDGIPFPAVRRDPIVEMAAGELHLVLRLSSGIVLTFGDDSMGQLGQQKLARRVTLTRRAPAQMHWPAPLTGLPAVAVGAGRMYSAALLRDGSMMVWGENSHSQCGVHVDQTPIDASPADLLSLSAISAVPLRVPLPQGVSVARFSLGEFHTILLTTAGDVYAFGDPSFGATCNRTDDDEADAMQNSDKADTHGDAHGDASGGADLLVKPFRCNLPLRPGENVTEVVAGSFHSMVVTSSGRVLVWGDNSHGQLGVARRRGFIYSLMQDAQQPGSDISDEELDRELDDAFEIAELDVGLYAHERLLALWTRTFHSAALSDHGRLILWGDNAYGHAPRAGQQPVRVQGIAG
jgi:alpha-tubulin suppressor-like RCC1 family protein